MFSVLKFESFFFWKQPYYVAETTMPGGNGFDFYGASRSFNVLAEYLFGKVVYQSPALPFCIFFMRLFFDLNVVFDRTR